MVYDCTGAFRAGAGVVTLGERALIIDVHSLPTKYVDIKGNLMDEGNNVEGITVNWMERLRDSGFRLTGSRRVLVETLVTSDQVLNAEQIHDLAAQQYPDLGRATVYRTLDLLVDVGLIRRVHDEHGCHSYMSVPDESARALLICSNCRQVEDVPVEVLDQFNQSILATTGFRVHSRTLQISGLCNACR